MIRRESARFGRRQLGRFKNEVFVGFRAMRYALCEACYDNEMVYAVVKIGV